MSAAAERIPLPFTPGRRYTKEQLLEGVRGALRGFGLDMVGLSNDVENKTLDHLFGDGTYTVTAPTSLALVTSAVAESDTAATLVEAAYTGYARKALAAADLSAAASGSKTNSAQQQFANCTAGSSVVIGWAVCTSSSGAGDVIFFGTCTSTTISTTQTPATIAASGLVLNLD